MIINDEIRGAWDQPTNTIVMQNVESSHLQSAAIQFADKVNHLMELNERSLRSFRTGGAHDDDEGRRKGHWEEDVGGNRRNYSNRKRFLLKSIPEPFLALGARAGHVRGVHMRGKGHGHGHNRGESSHASIPRNPSVPKMTQN